MKKCLLIFFMTLMLCGCGKENPENIIADLKKEITNIKSYKITGNMEINNDEETFTYSLESYYLKDDYYKVILVNQTNNHEQIILKNNEDIYVITPALNKSFKFQSEWPENSSQAYLLGNIIQDIENDKSTEVTKKDNGYIIKSAVNYPNNADLKYQKIYLNNKKMIEKVEVYTENDIVKIKVSFDNMDLKAGLKESDFKLENYIKEQSEEEKNNTTPENETSCKNDSDSTCENPKIENETSENTNNENITNNSADNKTEETTNIENIIYPLYIPSNTFLTSSETIETANGNRIILTFSGEKNFVLIEEATIANHNMEIVPVYGEPLLLSESIGALSANSLSWDVNNISYYLASTELTVSEMQSIANSLGNSTLVSNTK